MQLRRIANSNIDKMSEVPTLRVVAPPKNSCPDHFLAASDQLLAVLNSSSYLAQMVARSLSTGGAGVQFRTGDVTDLCDGHWDLTARSPEQYPSAI